MSELSSPPITLAVLGLCYTVFCLAFGVVGSLGTNVALTHLSKAIGHEGFVGLSVSKVHISTTRWHLFTLTAVALRFCRATEKTPSIGRNKRRATARSLNDLP
jgi:hypothetical protein